MLKKLFITLSLFLFSAFSYAESVLGINVNQTFELRAPLSSFHVNIPERHHFFSETALIHLDDRKKVSRILMTKEYEVMNNDKLSDAFYDFNLYSNSLKQKYKDKYNLKQFNSRYQPNNILYVGKAETDLWHINLTLTKHLLGGSTVYTVELSYEKFPTLYYLQSDLKKDL